MYICIYVYIYIYIYMYMRLDIHIIVLRPDRANLEDCSPPPLLVGRLGRRPWRDWGAKRRPFS